MNKQIHYFLGDNLYTGLSVAKECFMIPSNVDIAVITATPSTDQTKAEIKIESSLGQTLDVITQNIYLSLFIFNTYMFIYSSF